MDEKKVLKYDVERVMHKGRIVLQIFYKTTHFSYFILLKRGGFVVKF